MKSMHLDARQRQIGFAAAIVAAVVFPIVSTHTAASIAVPLALAALMGVFVWRGQPPTAGAAALGLSFVPQNQFRLLGSPYILYGFWIMYTASRAAREQREVAQAVARAEKAKASPPAPGATGGTRPAASKRYTPPAARRKRR